MTFTPIGFSTAETTVCSQARTFIIESLELSMLRTTVPAHLAGTGHRSMIISAPIRLGHDAEYDIRFIQLLREAASFGITVDWIADGFPECDPSLLYHLPPPRTVHNTKAAKIAESWQTQHRHGACFYRRGPDFLHVKDHRDRIRTLRYRLEGALALDVFDQLLQCVYVPTVPAPLGAHLDKTKDARLAVQVGPWASVLPYRFRHWLVPEHPPEEWTP